VLEEEGPFTVFLPTNLDFSKLDTIKLNSLLESHNKDMLSSIINNHIVSGKLLGKDIVEALVEGNGEVSLPTLSGQKITLILESLKIYIKDAHGNFSEIISTDVMNSNGVIHVVDKVIFPN